MAVSFRPHIIRKVNKSDGFYTENGDFVEGQQTYGEEVECRYEPNGRANSVSLGDGRVFLYNYTIYLCQECPQFSFGEQVEVFNQDGESIGVFQVQGFHRGQLDAKLWV